MNILVTGGAGFIGSHLCEYLSSKGHQIFCLDNFNNFYDPLIKRNNIKGLLNSDHFTLFEVDFTEYNKLEAIFKDYSFDMIIHLAAMAGVRPSIEDPLLYNKVNITGLMHLLEMAKVFNVPYFIFGSSSSIYGLNKKTPFSEDDFVDYPISPYAATKKAGELICHTYYHLHKISIISLRFFTVYGPRQRPDLAIHKFTDLIDSGIAIPKFGDGTTKRDYTYVDDIIDGIEKSVNWITEQKGPIYEVFNLGESQTVELNKLISLIESALNKTAIIKELANQPGDVPITFANIDKAIRILGYNPKTKIEDGIFKFISWFRGLNI